MQRSIFSTYKNAENRVTSSILAVLQNLSLKRIERLLGAIMEQSEFELAHFENQPAKDKDKEGVPDAIISSSCCILLETKIVQNHVDLKQLKRHLKRFKNNESVQVLLVLTPDASRPSVIDQINDEKVVWASFASLDQAIDELLKDDREVVSEREAFLLRHLQIMMIEEGLLSSSDNVVVIPARRAWPEYHQIHAYVCQADRVFQRVGYLAFYSMGKIEPLVPKILKTYESVEFKKSNNKGRLEEIMNKLITSGQREEGEKYKVILLTTPDDQETQRLEVPITNDLTSDSGRVTAFTQNQRYVSLDQLKTARKTSDLVRNKK